MSHLWPLKPARVLSQPLASSPTACHCCLSPGDTVPAQPSPGLERQQQPQPDAPGARPGQHAGAAGTVRIASPRPAPCSPVGRSQAGVKQLPRRSCAWLRTARSRLAERRLQRTRCGTMLPTNACSRRAACSPIAARGGRLLKSACSSPGIDAGAGSPDQQLERWPCPRGALCESPA